jgi:ribosomal protein S1
VYEFLEQVRLRPGVWLPGGSLRHLETLLIGYRVALGLHGVDEPFPFWPGEGFSQWLRKQRGRTTAVGWSAEIERETPAGISPVQEFFRLLDAYRVSPEAVAETEAQIRASAPQEGLPVREFLAALRPGDTRIATVTGVGSSGVRVDLHDIGSPGPSEPPGPPRAKGFIAVHELSWRRFAHPSEIVEPGRRLEVEVIHVDVGRESVSLSAKACEDQALRVFLLGLERGDIRTGTVVSVRDYGVLVRLDGEPPDRCTGLIRLPDPSGRSGQPAPQPAEPGCRITVQVLGADTRRGQVFLSANVSTTPAAAGPA